VLRAGKGRVVHAHEEFNEEERREIVSY
jgi:hypothetical protein